MLKTLVIDLSRTYFVNRVNPIIGCKDRGSVNAWVLGCGILFITLAITLYQANARDEEALSLTIKILVTLLAALGTHSLVMAINIFNAEGEVNHPTLGVLDVSSRSNAIIGNAFIALTSVWRLAVIFASIPLGISFGFLCLYFMAFPYMEGKLHLYAVHVGVAAAVFCVKELRPEFWAGATKNIKGVRGLLEEVSLLIIFVLTGLKIPVISWYWAEKMAERYSPQRRQNRSAS